jgi:hypothetical protein
MKFLSIDNSNYNKPMKTLNAKSMKTNMNMKKSRKTDRIGNSLTRIQILNNSIKRGNQIFLLIYMEGCGPCNATRPEWKKVENILGEKYKNKHDDIIVADIDHTLLKYVKPLFNPAGFPTMKYISQKGKYTQDYEKADISNKNRQVDSFIEWIEKTIKRNNSGGGRKTRKYTRKST